MPGGVGYDTAVRRECARYRDLPDSAYSPEIVNPATAGIVELGGSEDLLAGPITNIPEFHDCQKFLKSGDNGAMQYDSLFAIFAVPSLDGVVSQLRGDRVTWDIV